MIGVDNRKKVIIIIIIVLIVFGAIFSFSLLKSKKVPFLNLFSQIQYKVPSKFEKDEDYNYSRYYHYRENDVSCSLNLNVYEKEYYDDFEEWFKDRIRFNLNDEIGKLEEIDLNHSKALYIDKKSRGSFDYYYGIESADYYYLITYNIYDYKHGDRSDIDSNLCYTYKDKIVESISVK